MTSIQASTTTNGQSKKNPLNTFPPQFDLLINLRRVNYDALMRRVAYVRIGESWVKVASFNDT